MTRGRLLSASTLTSLVILVAIGAGSSGCADASAQSTSVTFRLDWTPGAEHSFLYAAVEKGYFREQGLDVAIQAGDGSTTSAKLVGTGTIDYALCSGDTALTAASAGVPIRALAVLYSRAPTVIYSRKDRNITHPKDLEGHKYGANMKSTTYQQFLAFCRLTGVDLSKVEVLATGGVAQDILTNAVDASGAYTYLQPVQCELEGVQVNEMLLSDFGLNSYSMSIIGNRNTLRPDVTRRLLKAALRAFQEMINDPSSALQAFLKANPTANKEFEARKLAKLVSFLKENLKTQGHVGWHSLQGWKQTQEFLLSQKLISSEIDLNGFFTTEFLPKSEG